MISASDWCPLERHTVRGFVRLHLEPSGLVLRDCTVHRQGDKEWVGLPGKPQIDRDGQPRRDPQTSKPLYVPVVDVEHRARDRFQAEALAAVHELLGETVS